MGYPIPCPLTRSKSLHPRGHARIDKVALRDIPLVLSDHDEGQNGVDAPKSLCQLLLVPVVDLGPADRVSGFFGWFVLATGVVRDVDLH